MARAAREKSPSGIYKVLLRGGGELLYDDEDRKNMRERIEKHLDVIAYAILKNAVCLIVRESDKGISLDIKPLTTSYARYFNAKYHRDGSIFMGRFKSAPVSMDKLAYEAAAICREAEFLNDKTAVTYYNKDIISEAEFDCEFSDTEKPDKFYGVLGNVRNTADSVKKRTVKPKPLPPPVIEQSPEKTPAPSPSPSQAPADRKRKKQQMPSWLL